MISPFFIFLSYNISGRCRFMKFEDGKLILTEAELAEVKKANTVATPSIAGFYLRSFIKNKNLAEDLEKQPDASFYVECIQAYRKKNYEVI